MKKKIISIVMIIILFCILTSCHESAEKNNNEENKESAYIEAIALLEDGEYEKAYIEFNKLGDYKETQKYLRKFHYVPISMVATEEGLEEPVMQTTISYNQHNLPESATVLEAGYTYYYAYDDKGNITEKKSIFNNQSESIYQYYYNADGQCTTMLHTLPDGDSYTFDYTYNENGKLIKAIYTGANANTYSIAYEYDENGNILKEITEQSFGGDLREYTYDKNGNMINVTFGSIDKRYVYYSYTNTYNENNELIEKVFQQGSEKYEYCFSFNDDRSEIRISGESNTETKLHIICKYKLVYIDFDISDEALDNILEDTRLFMDTTPIR